MGVVRAASGKMPQGCSTTGNSVHGALQSHLVNIHQSHAQEGTLISSSPSTRHQEVGSGRHPWTSWQARLPASRSVSAEPVSPQLAVSYFCIILYLLRGLGFLCPDHSSWSL
ncbi:Hypothetical predicted protein, partial [Marmota monax]